MKNKIVYIALTAVMLCTSAKIFAQDQSLLKTLFKALPNDALPYTVSATLDYLKKPSKDMPEGVLEVYVKKVQNGTMKVSGIREALINICDETNRSLKLDSDTVGYWEMNYWNLQNGNQLVMVNNFNIASFYLYSKGKMTPTEKFGIKEMHKHIKTSIAWDENEQWVSFYSPRNGTSLTVVINGQDCMIFQWKNEKFIPLKDYQKKQDGYRDAANGLLQAIKMGDPDACLQYILPSYIQEQCMQMLDGNKEQFICELISAEEENGYITPASLKDIKNITLIYDPENGFAEYRYYIELKDGRTYHYYLSFDNVEIYKTLKNGNVELMQRIPYITGQAFG